jgi:hypothetical protein
MNELSTCRTGRELFRFRFMSAAAALGLCGVVAFASFTNTAASGTTTTTEPRRSTRTRTSP